ncbi:uncharacterized protein Dyak_GE28611, partial [Drosophila yakuba]
CPTNSFRCLDAPVVLSGGRFDRGGGGGDGRGCVMATGNATAVITPALPGATNAIDARLPRAPTRVASGGGGGGYDPGNDRGSGGGGYQNRDRGGSSQGGSGDGGYSRFNDNGGGRGGREEGGGGGGNRRDGGGPIRNDGGMRSIYMTALLEIFVKGKAKNVAVEVAFPVTSEEDLVALDQNISSGSQERY